MVAAPAEATPQRPASVLRTDPLSLTVSVQRVLHAAAQCRRSLTRQALVILVPRGIACRARGDAAGVGIPGVAAGRRGIRHAAMQVNTAKGDAPSPPAEIKPVSAKQACRQHDFTLRGAV